jgi:hypothetical protein
LVVKKLPNSNTLLNLDLALVDGSGGAWMPPAGFLLKGVYKNSSTNETEVYGMVGNDLTKFQFTLEESTQSNSVETYAPGTLPKVLKLKNVPDPITASPVESLKVTGLEVAERENVAGKDLNNDNTIGFKVSSTVASIATGTALGSANIAKVSNVDDDPVEQQTIYVVGKSLSTMGATSSRTANQNTLRMFEGENQVYWKPNTGQSIRSIVESTSSIKVYARSDSATTALTEYTFTRSDGTGLAGWNFDSSSELLSNQIVDLETSNQRDLNGDTIIGLRYAASQPISGVIKGSLGSEDFYFAGLASKGITNGTTPLGIDTAKLLKNDDGSAWQPTGLSGTMVFESTITANDSAPDTAEFVLRSASSTLTFFNDQYQLVS